MSNSVYHLAQVNIARMFTSLEDPRMADFVANLDPINALADSAPGFVWRFKTDAGDATAVRPYADDRIIINFSVWEDAASLREFVFNSAHMSIMRRRREWFERLTDLYLALWWIPAGHTPSVAEAVARLDYLKQRGPSAEAFTFREFYPSPDASEPDLPIPFNNVSPASSD